MKIVVGLARCKGFACCTMEAPDLFDIDDVSGKSDLLVESSAEDQRAQAEAAVRACPANVVSLIDD